MEKNNLICVEVFYAARDLRQELIKVWIESGATVLQAIEQSELLNHFPEIDLDKQKVGIYSQQCALDHVLKSGDRIEIYRPLAIDPKEARRAKASKKANLK